MAGSNLGRILLFIMVAVSLFTGYLLGGVIQGPFTRTETTRITLYRTVTVSTTIVLSAGPSGYWREVIRFTGSNRTITQPFYIPSKEWRITWSYGTSRFAAFGWYAFPAGQNASYVNAVSSREPSYSSTTYIFSGPGNFYLQIFAYDVQYTVIVEAPG